MSDNSNNIFKNDESLTKPAGVLIKTTLVDFPGKVAASYFLRGCNLRCPYCYNAELVKGISHDGDSDSAAQSDTRAQTFVSPVEVLEHLNKRKNVMNGLVISGGEPLLNPVTPEIIREAKRMGYSVKLDTNGTLPLILQKLTDDPDTKPDYIAMDIKTSPARYRTDIHPIKNFINADIEGLLKASLEIIQKALDKNYEIRTVLVPGLVEKEDIKNIASLLPCDAQWFLAQFRNENCINPSYNDITPYTDAKLKELTDLAKSFIPAAVLR